MQSDESIFHRAYVYTLQVMWTWEHNMTMHMFFMRRSVNLHTSTQVFHELDESQFSQKGSIFRIIRYPSQNGVDYSRKYWEKNPLKQKIFSANGDVFKKDCDFS